MILQLFYTDRACHTQITALKFCITIFDVCSKGGLGDIGLAEIGVTGQHG